MLSNGLDNPQNSPPLRVSGPPFNTCFWATRFRPTTASRWVQTFCVHRSKGSQCFPQGRTTPQIANSLVASAHPSNKCTWFLGPTRLNPLPKRHLDRFSRVCKAHEHDQYTDTQTDYIAPSVAIGRFLGVITRMKKITAVLQRK